MRFRPVPCGISLSALVLLLVAHGGSVIAAAKTEAVRQLIQSTSLVNILRTDAEQATLIADRLPEELPAELRPDLRRVIDQNLGYNEMEDALVKSVAASLDSSVIDDNLRWWASDSGRAISKMESSVYASIFPGSTFEIYNPTTEASHEVSEADASELMTRGLLAEFLTELLNTTIESRSCLVATVNMVPNCSPRDLSVDRDGNAQLTQFLTKTIGDHYSRISSGDLSSYIKYLRSESAQSAGRALRASLLTVERRSWQNASKQASLAIDTYARATFGTHRDAALRQTTADIDASQNLSRARITLDLMRRAAPSDPAVLVQSARVVLKQAPDLTGSDNAPSVPHIDAQSLQIAQQFLDQALTVDPKRAEALMLSGHVAYLKLDFRRSVTLLRQAKSIGTNSPWLRINLGDALWAMADQPPFPNHDLAKEAADEFEAALASSLPSGAELRAVHQLSAIYPEIGDLRKADSYQRRYIGMVEGRNKAYALHRYAHFLLFYAHDVDAAVVAARQAVQLYNFPVGRQFLVETLAIKGGMLHAAGQAGAAAPLFAEAEKIEPDLESICPDLARLPAMLPGVFGIHAEGLVRDFSGSIGGRTLVYASMYATADEIKQLIDWGANPNYLDADEGTPLHRAILADNVAAVRMLLTQGANPLTPFVDGRTPSQLADYPSDPKRAEILAVVTKAAGDHASATGPIGTPLKAGYRYRLKRPLIGNGWGNDYPEGVELIFKGSNCGYTNPALACFVFASADNPGLPRDVAFAKDQLSAWRSWFDELGPEKSSSAR